GPGDDKLTPEEAAEARVHLRLNTIRNTKLLTHYESLVTRELSLQASIRAAAKANDMRLPDYQATHQDVLTDLETTRKELIVLEKERIKLLRRLGKPDAAEEASSPGDRAAGTLDKILERLNSIEKRLERL